MSLKYEPQKVEASRLLWEEDHDNGVLEGGRAVFGLDHRREELVSPFGHGQEPRRFHLLDTLQRT